MGRPPAGPHGGRKFLQHPSVRALLEADHAVSPDEAIRARARHVVANALKLGWTGPPFDMQDLAEFCGFKIERSRAFTAAQDGRIEIEGTVWSLTGWRGVIRVNYSHKPVRQRFTIAHEICHALFPDFGKTTTRYDAVGVYDQPQRSPLEQLCNVGASELLMPLHSFHEQCAGTLASVEGVLRVAEHFDASAEAVARRWITLSPRPAALVIARPVDPRPHADPGAQGAFTPMDGGTAPPRLTIVSSVREGGKPLYLRAGTTLPVESVAHRVWLRAQTDARRPCSDDALEDWTRVAGLGRCRVSAVTLPVLWTEPASVMCLLHPVDSAAATGSESLSLL